MNFLPPEPGEIEQLWPPELDHFSASSAKMAVRCPEQWRQRYVLGKKQPPNLALITGGADHTAIQHSMEQKVESFVDLPSHEVEEKFGEELERRVERAGGIGDVEVKDGSETVTDKTRKQKMYDDVRSRGSLAVAAYHKNVSPTIQPDTVEQEFSVDVPGMPVPLIGYIDLVARPVQQTLMEMTPSIIERKRRTTAKRKPEPEWSLQGEVYQLAVQAPYDFHISVDAANPYVLTPSQTDTLRVPLAPRARAEMTIAQIAAEIAFYYSRFGPDHPWPVKGKLHPWACNYCGFRQQCWGWK